MGVAYGAQVDSGAKSFAEVRGLGCHVSCVYSGGCTRPGWQSATRNGCAGLKLRTGA